MVGALNYKLDECKDLSIEEMEFIIYHHKKHKDAMISSFGKLLGTTFSVKEIRTWDNANKGNKSGVKVYSDDETVLMPLTLVMNPELRENLKKMVSNNLTVSGGYARSEDEVVVPLGQVTPEEYKYFLTHKHLPQDTVAKYAEQNKKD